MRFLIFRAVDNRLSSVGFVVPIAGAFWISTQVEPEPDDTAGVVLRQRGGVQTLLRRALLRRRALSGWGLRKALQAAENPCRSWAMLSSTSMKLAQLLEYLVRAAFPDEVNTIAMVLEEYARPACDNADDVDDEEMQDLVEELVANDQINAGDLKAFRNELKERAIRGLERRQRDEQKKRDEEAKQQAAKKKDTKAKAKAKAKQLKFREPVRRAIARPAVPEGQSQVVVAVPAPQNSDRLGPGTSSNDPMPMVPPTASTPERRGRTRGAPTPSDCEGTEGWQRLDTIQQRTSALRLPLRVPQPV